MTDITSLARAFADSYISAVTTISRSPDATTAEIAQAITSHYHTSDFAAYQWGQSVRFTSPDNSRAMTQKYLESWVKSGIGINYYHEKTRIEVISSSSALCWMTWGVRPQKDDVDEWTWENVYAFRLPPGSETGYWEFCVSDQESAEAMKRIPNIFDM